MNNLKWGSNNNGSLGRLRHEGRQKRLRSACGQRGAVGLASTIYIYMYNAHFYFAYPVPSSRYNIARVRMGDSVSIGTPHAVARHFRVTPPNQEAIVM